MKTRHFLYPTLLVLCFSQTVHAGVIGKVVSKVATSQPAQRAATMAASAQRSSQLGKAESARNIYSMPRSTSPVASSPPGITTPMPGILPKRRQAPPIANDVFQKVNGQLVRQTGKKETLLKNGIQGKVGEVRAFTDLRSAGYKVKPQVTAKLGDKKRVIDFVVKHPTSNKIMAYEVKTGKALRSKKQKDFDLRMEQEGAKLVGKNAGNLAGTAQKMQTIVSRY